MQRNRNLLVVISVACDEDVGNMTQPHCSILIWYQNFDLYKVVDVFNCERHSLKNVFFLMLLIIKQGGFQNSL